MGNACCQVHNKTHRKVCVVTFNQAELVYNKYTNMYTLDPGQSIVVEAITNPIGLKVAIIYDAIPDKDERKPGRLEYQRWAVKKDKILTITNFERSDISTFGDDCNNEGKSHVNARSEQDFATAVECLTFQKQGVRDATAALRRK